VRYFDSFGRCRRCGSIYRLGSHYDRMRRLAEEVLHGRPRIGENQPEVQIRRSSE
jgi:uncharacterized protein with PIN domain